MGYTHYFRQHCSASDAGWAELKAQLRKAFLHLPATSSSAGGFYGAHPLEIADSLGEELISDPGELFRLARDVDDFVGEAIIFNGSERAEMDHDTFLLTQQKQAEPSLFRFCKTARKPYDWLVVATLILAHNECPGVWEISSDGGREDWAPVAQWLASVLGKEIKLPAGVGGGTYVPDTRVVRPDWRELITDTADLYF